MQAKGVDDDEGAMRVFSSYLVQQVGGRDWSAQEVSHVNMGLHTVWGSHDFNTKSLVTISKLRNNINQQGDDADRADLPSDFELYLNRGSSAFAGTRGADAGQRDLAGNLISIAKDVLACSFVDFYRKYQFASAGPGRKGQRTIKHIERPTVCVVKPQMPFLWGRAGHPKRADYCRVQLQSYMPFRDVASEDGTITITAANQYSAYMAKYEGSFERAYEEFAKSPDAPSCCHDDVKPVVFEHEGTPVGDEHAEAHEGFAVFEPTHSMTLDKMLHIEPVDWWARNTDGRYDDALLADAARWQTRVKMGSAAPAPVQVDITKLNEEQSFVYRVVKEHDDQWRRKLQSKPLRALICGTAGSGKVRISRRSSCPWQCCLVTPAHAHCMHNTHSQTFLIRALKQLLGDRCVVCAPTGVAADNIGGRTYHSLLPMPRTDPDRDDITLADGARLAQMEIELNGVEYLIIDEMSMVGRRSLAHIDELLRQAKGPKELFGNMNIILVGLMTISKPPAQRPII